MPFTQLHPGKRNHHYPRRAADRGSSITASSSHSVGHQLRHALGERYSIAWLADQLKCSIERAEALDGYWVVPNAHSRVNGLTVFSRVLQLDLPRLQAVFEAADQALETRGLTKPITRTPAAKPTEQPEAKRVVTIGSNEGSRELRSPQPKIVWRKVRHHAAPVAS